MASSLSSPHGGDDSDDEIMDGVMVSLRLRPLRDTEQNQEISWEYSKKQKCIVEKTGMGQRRYTFDNVFMGGNQECYDLAAAKIVKKALHGYNGTIFAYGQTGSGKTHSMMGSPWPLCAETEVGILPLALTDIFNHIEKDKDHIYLLRCSYMEIYSESINDLLHVGPDGRPTPSGDMKIIQDDPIKGAVIGGLIESVVTSTEQACELLNQGEENRHVAGTTMNDRSSRSHCIFRIVIEKKMTTEAAAREKLEFDRMAEDEGGMTQIGGSGAGEDEGEVHVSYLNMVDLAGSERQAHTGATGSLLKEGAAINKSLSALAEVISKLSEMFLKKEAEQASGAKSDIGSGGSSSNSTRSAAASITARKKVADHIPYRNSKLTRILKQSLGGNTFTSVLLCVSPAPVYHDTSVSTIQFGNMCKTIKNRAQTNVVKDSKTLLREYKKQIAKLSDELEQSRSVANASQDGGAGGDRAWQDEKAQLEKRIAVLSDMFLQGKKEDSPKSRSGDTAGRGTLRRSTSTLGFPKNGSGRHKPHRQRMASVFVTNDNTGGISFRNDNPNHTPAKDWQKAFDTVRRTQSREKVKKLQGKEEEQKKKIAHLEKQLRDNEEEQQKKIDHLEEQLRDSQLSCSEAKERLQDLQRSCSEAKEDLKKAKREGDKELARHKADAHYRYGSQSEEISRLERELFAEREKACQAEQERDQWKEKHGSERNTIQKLKEKMVWKDGRRLSVFKMDLDNEDVRIKGELEELANREQHIQTNEAKLANKEADLQSRRQKLTADIARCEKREMLLDQRIAQVSQREDEVANAKNEIAAKEKVLDHHAKDIKKREDFQERQVANLDDREEAITRMEKISKERVENIDEVQRDVVVREKRVKEEQKKLRSEREHAEAAGRIQSAFRSYISSTYMTRMSEVNERAIRVASRAKEVEVQTKALAARWMILENKEGAIHALEMETAARASKSLELRRLLGQQGDELKAKHRKLDAERKALAHERARFEEDSNGVEAAAVAIKAQQGDVELKEKRAERLQKHVRAEQHRLVGLQDAARALVAQAAEMDERSKELDRHEAGIIDKLSEVDVIRRADIADLTTKLAMALRNADGYKMELSRANAKIAELHNAAKSGNIRTLTVCSNLSRSENTDAILNGKATVRDISRSPQWVDEASVNMKPGHVSTGSTHKGSAVWSDQEPDAAPFYQAVDESSFSPGSSTTYSEVSKALQTPVRAKSTAKHGTNDMSLRTKTSGKKKKEKELSKRTRRPPQRGKTVQISL